MFSFYHAGPYNLYLKSVFEQEAEHLFGCSVRLDVTLDEPDGRKTISVYFADPQAEVMAKLKYNNIVNLYCNRINERVKQLYR